VPNLTWDISPTNDRAINIDGRAAEGGFVFTLCAILKDGDCQSGECHVQAGTYKGQPTADAVLTVLLDDYVYPGHSPSWTGKIPLEESEGLFAAVRSAQAVTVRVIGKTLKQDP